MSNEYDYSGLYNNTSGSGQPNGQNPQPEQSAPAQNPQPQQSSYPNVGSSGVNTANTARTDYSSYNSGSTSGQNPQQDSNGYTSSFSGYSYSSAPQQPPVPQKKKGSKVLLRVLACVGVTRDGFESIVDVKDSCKYAQELTATGAVISAVEANPLAIGYASLSAVGETVKMVTVGGVACSEETVKDGSYEVQRPFVFVTNKSVTLSEQAQAFFDFATSADAADLIRTAGAVPVNE